MTHFLTIKDPEKYSIKDAKESTVGIVLEVNIARCDPKTSPVECADDEEALASFEEH